MAPNVLAESHQFNSIEKPFQPTFRRWAAACLGAALSLLTGCEVQAVNEPGKPVPAAPEVRDEIPRPISLENVWFPEEVTKRVMRNSVQIRLTPNELGKKQSLEASSSCSGFIVNRPPAQYVVTARHCIPNKFSVDGKIIPTVDESGNSLFHTYVLTSAGTAHNVTLKRFFPEENASDVLVAKIDDTQKIPVDGLQLSKNTNVTKGDKLLHVNYPGKIRSQQVHQSTVISVSSSSIISLTTDIETQNCTKGTSGSAIVDDQGEVVGILYARRGDKPEKLTLTETEHYGLAPTAEGVEASYCYSAPIKFIESLLQE